MEPQRKRKLPSSSSSSGASESDCMAETASSNVKVVIRIRPENEAEQSEKYSTVVKVIDESLLVFDPKEESSPGYFHGKRRRGRDITKRKNRDIKFAFDCVFDEHSTSKLVYENTTKVVLDGVLDGYNCSVFAYGATGAGKTHTMLGKPNQPGVIFLTMMDLYARIEAMRDEKICDVAVSYLEVYNEEIKDLLLPGGYLPVREDPQKGVVVQGLSLHKPRDAEELMHMLEFGNQNRTQHPTDANKESSRSHAVFQVFVRQKDRTADVKADVRVAKMSLIDLAGSERATVTTNRGARFREGANINKSLLALGNCINALADARSSKSQHVPYRNSKLTRLLKDSLGGNCRTVMIAAVSPSSMSYEDTYNTLKYANRAKNIRARVKRNVMSVDLHMHRYVKIIDELRVEVSELKLKLQTYESDDVFPERRLAVTDPSLQHQIDATESAMHAIFMKRLSLRKEFMELECKDRHLMARIYKFQRYQERLGIVTLDEDATERAKAKMKANIEKMSKRKGTVRKRCDDIQVSLDDNTKELDSVLGEMKDNLPEVLEARLKSHHLEVELKDTKRQVKLLRYIIRQQDREISNNGKLINTLLETVRQQFYILKGNGLATSGTENAFRSIQLATEDDQGISWADQSVSENSGVATESHIDSLVNLPICCIKTTPSTPNSQRKSRHRRSSTPKCRSTPSAMSVTPSAQTTSSVQSNTPVKGILTLSSKDNLLEAGVARLPNTPTTSHRSSRQQNSHNTPETPKENQHSINFNIKSENTFRQNTVNNDQSLDNTFTIGGATKENIKIDILSEVTSGIQKSKADDLSVVTSGGQNHERNECKSTITNPYEQISKGKISTVLHSPKSQQNMKLPQAESVFTNTHKSNCDVQRNDNNQSAQLTIPEIPNINVCILSTNKSQMLTNNHEHTNSRPSSVNSGTVTKEGKSTAVSPPNVDGVKKPVVRAMDFTNFSSSPVPGKSYSAALKSPAPIRPMSALASNLPQTPTHTPQHSQSSLRDRRVTFVMSDEPAKEPERPLGSCKNDATKQNNTTTPSSSKNPGSSLNQLRQKINQNRGQEKQRPLREMNQGNQVQMAGHPTRVAVKTATPKYMRLTASAASKQRRHRRSISANNSKENTPPVGMNIGGAGGNTGGKLRHAGTSSNPPRQLNSYRAFGSTFSNAVSSNNTNKRFNHERSKSELNLNRMGWQYYSNISSSNV
ncbi:unnamed protein product [Owenia fusiformis]|uniref:Uncharacterized protein n=1 Tax=Owenia fusiformis TaxID=6347 RepID=A0A8J1V0T7_OWEFU|nr:unnamed protein product [Owenia fusiformis]